MGAVALPARARGPLCLRGPKATGDSGEPETRSIVAEQVHLRQMTDGLFPPPPSAAMKTPGEFGLLSPSYA
ncbi:hypothetical protein NDU88_002515 [Pleurodeles waltl]|uniref:Uncharacterized protein n=1 Tax=Pleurodeles waltl TaxID=8319 RepID=A0AAV7RE05_PLEWA|nr:hypothetical protein NDU88_002515 [Pleurodeles waltl]